MTWAPLVSDIYKTFYDARDTRPEMWIVPSYEEFAAWMHVVASNPNPHPMLLGVQVAFGGPKGTWSARWADGTQVDIEATSEEA